MNKPEGRFYTPLTLCLSGLFGVLAVRLTIAMLTTLYGPFSFGAAAPPDPVRYGFWLVDDDTRVDREAVARRVSAWQRVLTRAHEQGVELVRAATLELLVERGATVVVVASGRTLDADEARALEAFVARGAGALLIGSIGTTDEEGRWRGYEVMQGLLGVDEVVPLARDASRSFEVGRPNALLSGRLGGTEHLPLISEVGVPAIQNPGAELLWSSDGAGKTPNAATLRRSIGEGRLLWIGAGPESSVAGNASALRLHDSLYLDALHWAARQPAIVMLASDVPLHMRERIHAGVQVEGRYRLRVEVSNRSEDPASHVVLRLFFNRETGAIDVVRTTVLQRLPGLERAPQGEWLDFSMPKLAGNSSLSLLVDTPQTSWQ
ncbi:MAG: DUF4350 domain-containing protein [bacterium]|nr:DUF4350 domain-containing protein [bacterium]